MEDKQKRFQKGAKVNLKVTHLRSSSMGNIIFNNNKFQDNNTNNSLVNLKKNLREELNSMIMMPHDSEGEY